MTDQKNQGAAIPTPQGAAGRLFRMIVQGNALRLVFVLIAIVISAAASVGASVFLESLTIISNRCSSWRTRSLTSCCMR